MNEGDFPARCFRGIRKRDWMNADNRLTSAAFDWNLKTADLRRMAQKPPGFEISINWDDNPEAERKSREDRTNAQYGIASIPLSALDYITQLPAFPNALFWERSPLAGNPYHGNLVCGEGLPRQMLQCMSGLLALHAEILIHRSDEPLSGP